MRRLPSLLGVLLLLALAGCGSDDDGGKPGDPEALLGRAFTATDKARSYRARMDIDAAFGGQTVAVNGTVLASSDQRRALLKGKYSDGGSPQEMIVMTVNGRNFAGGEYIESALPPGKRWALVNDQGPSMVSISDFVELLQESDDAKFVGEEDVRGEPTTRVSAPVDVQKLAERSDSKFADEFARAGGDKLAMTMEVWVAKDDDRISRMNIDMKEKGGPGRLGAFIEMLDYDVDLSAIREPAEAQVAEQPSG
ncbi:MAG TPA: hypothetical protein VF533_22530 [Solirubrobacteraceae bacterium]|jgi:hypothetical protein